MKKPNLKVTAKDFIAFQKRGAKNLTKKEHLAIANDLKTVLEFMASNEDLLIDLNWYEHKESCGTYRCVVGWWCIWLRKRVYQKDEQTGFFEKIFSGSFLCDLFELYRYSWGSFFGRSKFGTLEDRLSRANNLIGKIKAS